MPSSKNNCMIKRAEQAVWSTSEVRVSRRTLCTFFTANGHTWHIHTYVPMYTHTYVHTCVVGFNVDNSKVTVSAPSSAEVKAFLGHCLPLACLYACLHMYMYVCLWILTEWRAHKNKMKWRRSKRVGSGRVIHGHFIIMGYAYGKQHREVTTNASTISSNFSKSKMIHMYIHTYIHIYFTWSLRNALGLKQSSG